MYNVHVKRYTVAQARERLAELLSAAEQGQPIVIERRGVRFSVQALRPARRSARPSGVIVFVDPAVLEGRWTWGWKGGVLRFSGSRQRR